MINQGMNLERSSSKGITLCEHLVSIAHQHCTVNKNIPSWSGLVTQARHDILPAGVQTRVQGTLLNF